MSRKIKKTYTQEFKVEAVRLITERGYSILKAARHVDISDSTLDKWKRALENENSPQAAFPGKGNLKDPELAALPKARNNVYKFRHEL